MQNGKVEEWNDGTIEKNIVEVLLFKQQSIGQRAKGIGLKKYCKVEVLFEILAFR
jgi:hypothetical protein